MKRFTVSTRSKGDGSDPSYVVYYDYQVVAVFPINDPVANTAHDWAHDFATVQNEKLERAEKQAAKDTAENVVRTLHGVRLTKEVVISPGLFYAESPDDGMARLHDGQRFRGYTTNWQSEKNPNGVRIHVWDKRHSKDFKKRYATYDKAVKGLIFYGRKLNAAIAA
jgi:hypothetical protein